MKKTAFILLIIAFAPSTVFSDGLQFGVQLSSDSSAAVLFRSDFVETGITARVTLADGASAIIEEFVPGMYLGMRFHPYSDGTAITFGAEGRYGFGVSDVEYAEYIDLGPRIGFDYDLGTHISLSGHLFPLWISTREIDGVDNSWYLTALFPKAVVAFTFLF